MAASFRSDTIVERSDYIVERSNLSPLRSTPLNWKTPILRDCKRTSSPLGSESGSASVDEVLTVPLTWKKPALSSRINQINVSSTDDEEERGLLIHKRPRLDCSEETKVASSSSSTLDVDIDDGNFELESVLMDEEQFSIPSHNRHRSSTGLVLLDELLSTESNHRVEDEANQMGLASGSILEVTGTKASGKTTMLLQMAVLERLDSLQRSRRLIRKKDRIKMDEWEEASQTAAQILLIDTEGSIAMEQIAIIAGKCLQKNKHPLSDDSRLRLYETLLSGIHYCRCTSDYQIFALLRTLLPLDKKITTSSSQVNSSQYDKRDMKYKHSTTLPIRTSMIIIDSISYLTRAPIEDDAIQSRAQKARLQEELSLFASRCSQRGIKFVFSNQMSTVFLDKKGKITEATKNDAEAYLAPTMRKWNSCILGNHVWRIVLFRDARFGEEIGDRFAYILNRSNKTVDKADKVFQKDWSIWMPFKLL